MIILITEPVVIELIYFEGAVEINLTFLESNQVIELRASDSQEIRQ